MFKKKFNPIFMKENRKYVAMFYFSTWNIQI